MKRPHCAHRCCYASHTFLNIHVLLAYLYVTDLVVRSVLVPSTSINCIIYQPSKKAFEQIIWFAINMEQCFFSLSFSLSFSRPLSSLWSWSAANGNKQRGKFQWCYRDEKWPHGRRCLRNPSAALQSRNIWLKRVGGEENGQAWMSLHEWIKKRKLQSFLITPCSRCVVEV